MMSFSRLCTLPPSSQALSSSCGAAVTAAQGAVTKWQVGQSGLVYTQK
jgi:hypothetical protein